MSIFPTCVFVNHMESFGSTGTGVKDGFELMYGCWELNLVPLKEQQVLLNSEPDL